MEINLVEKVPKILSCKFCDYNTSRKSQMDRHLSTQKHIETTKGLQQTTNICDDMCITTNLSKYKCVNCNKIYKHHSSLWKHAKTCVSKKEALDEKPDTSDPSEKELIIMLLKQNAELMLKIGSNNNNNTTNSHNKTFNLQFFLNEECKDALNISEFVSSIKMDLEDLETTGKLGYVEGVSRIINKNLHELDQTKRPIHCSDVKREVLYIKNDEDQWVKENECKPVLTKAIKQVARENIKQISEWRSKHPDCNDPDSRNNDLYLNIVSNAMSGGSSDEQSKNYEKIITNVAKEVTIEKV